MRLTMATASVAAVTAADILYAKKTSPSLTHGRIHMESAMAINRAPEDCYGFWHKIENLPSFMHELQAVHVTGPSTSRWSMKIGRVNLEWEAEITEDKPGEVIAWRSLKGGDLEHSGSVRFEPRFGGPGTVVRVTMDYAPASAGGASSLAPGFLKAISEHRLRENLRKFKSVIEAGEAPTVKGQSSGRRES